MDNSIPVTRIPVQFQQPAYSDTWVLCDHHDYDTQYGKKHMYQTYLYNCDPLIQKPLATENQAYSIFTAILSVCGEI